MSSGPKQASDSPHRPVRVLLLFDSAFPYAGGGRETGIYHVCKYSGGMLDVQAVVFPPPRGVTETRFADAEKYCRFHPVFSWQSLARFRGYNFLARLDNILSFPRRAEAKARAVCRRWSPDVILCVHAGPTALVAMKLAREWGCKSVLNMRSLYVDEVSRTWRIQKRLVLGRLRRIERQVVRGIDLILANGEDTHAFCRERHGRTKPTVLVHNGVDTELFKPASGGKLRSELGLDDCVAFISNNPLRRIKGPQDAIAALSRMPEETRERCRLLFAAQGSFEPYREQAEALGVERLVKYLGFFRHDELPRYLNAADVAIHPVLFSAGTTHAGLETLACGLPQICYNAASLRSFCVNGLTGELVPRGDVDALAAAMTRLARDESLRRRMSAAARRKSLEFDWHVYVRNFVGAIRDVIE